MKGQYFIAILMTVAALSAPARGGILFGRKKPPPVDPNLRVPELLGLVKTSPDEHKRAQAAEELRQYDAKVFPDIVPVLIDVLASDPKAPVRAEAAHSLGRLRPVSQTVGLALETALAKDKSMRVRLQARSSLLQYHWSGYRTPKKDAVPPQTKEPPLAPPLPGLAPPVSAPPMPPPGQGPALPPAIVTGPVTGPLDPSVPVIRLTPTSPSPSPQLPLVPATTPKLQPTPAEHGPDLSTPPPW